MEAPRGTDDEVTSQSEEEEYKQYQYESFPNDGKSYIRIAKIHPSGFEEDIHITLERRPFDAKLPQSYEALSYAWGPPEDDPPSISVEVPEEGSACQGQLLVRSNLLSALRHLRFPDRPRYLWADAVCINQNADEEKAAQVVMMGDIFAAASRVVVWLGPAADNSERALEALDKIASLYDIDWDTYFLYPQGTKQPKVLPVPDELNDDETWRAVELLLHRNWFDRLWIRQEISLADQQSAIVVCGSSVTKWRTLRKSCIAMCNGTRPPRPDSLYGRLIFLKGLVFQTNFARLEYLRLDFSCSVCVDPRDRIYAIRGMLRESFRDLIAPSYTKPTVEVYQDAVIAYFALEKDLNILTECQSSPVWPGPSWIPDWSYDDGRTFILKRQMASSRLRAPWSRIDKKLQVSGILLTTITELNELLTQLTYQDQLQAMYDDIHNLIRDKSPWLDTAYPNGGTVLEALARTMCVDRFRDTEYGPGRDELAWYQAVVDLIVHAKTGEYHEYLDIVDPDELRTVGTEIIYSCRGRLLLRTADGYVGLAPSYAQTGDRIAVVLGCDQALVLRPVEPRQHTIIGECYVHGFVQGEKILGSLPPNTRLINRMTTREYMQQEFEDTMTGIVTGEDPRLANLGLDLTWYQADLAAGLPRSWVDVDVDELNKCLVQRGVQIETIELV